MVLDTQSRAPIGDEINQCQFGTSKLFAMGRPICALTFGVGQKTTIAMARWHWLDWRHCTQSNIGSTSDDKGSGSKVAKKMDICVLFSNISSHMYQISMYSIKYVQKICICQFFWPFLAHFHCFLQQDLARVELEHHPQRTIPFSLQMHPKIVILITKEVSYKDNNCVMMYLLC